jgi:hypothetical protein
VTLLSFALGKEDRASFSAAGVLSGHQAEVQPQRGSACQVPSVLLCSPVLAQKRFALAQKRFALAQKRFALAQKRFAEVHQVVSQGAPQRHAFDFVEAAHGQRRQPAISS